MRNRSPWSRKSIIVWVAAILALVPLWFVLTSERESVRQAMSTLLVVVAPVIVGLFKRIGPARRTTPRHAELDQLADALAVAVRNQWKTTKEARGLGDLIHTPWRLSDLPVTGGPDAALNLSVGQMSFKPLAGMTTVTRDDLQIGDISTLYRIFGGLPSGQLVVLGEAGTGKTSAAVVTLIELITIRDNLDADEKQGFPVPVLLPAQEWPLNVRIEDWLADRLARDFREIISRDQARALVERGGVAVIIDGFDEIGVTRSTPIEGAPTVDRLQQQRTALITALNQCGIQFMLISRADVLLETMRGRTAKPVHIRRAVAVELRPTSAAHIASYLRKTWPQSTSRERAVDQLADFVDRHPTGSLSTVLRIPFYLSLFRDALVPEQVPRLLEDPRVKDADERWLKELMLEQVIPNAYGHNQIVPRTSDERSQPSTSDYDEASARRYLQFLARKLEGDQSLRWWRIGSWAPAWQRISVTALTGTALSTLLVFLGNVVAGLVGRELPVQTGVGTVIGVVGGIAVGFASERRAPDSFQHARTSVLGRTLDRFNFAVGLGAALAVSIIAGVNVRRQYGFGVAFPVAFLAGVAVLVVVGFFSVDTATASGRQQNDPTFKRLRGMFNPVVALAVGLPVCLVHLSGFPWSFSVFSGVVYGLAFGLLDGMTQIQASSAVPNSPRNSWLRDGRKAITMGLGLGISIGITQGIGEAILESRHGDLRQALVIGVTDTVVIATLAGIALAVAVAEVWRTSLTFAQLRLQGSFPLRGMKFLDNAYHANILRAAGPVYQFRHASLREYLAQPDNDPDQQP